MNPWLKTAINAAGAGAVASLAAAYVAPGAFDLTTAHGWQSFGIVAAVGALKAIFMLFQAPPASKPEAGGYNPETGMYEVGKAPKQ